MLTPLTTPDGLAMRDALSERCWYRHEALQSIGRRDDVILATIKERHATVTYRVTSDEGEVRMAEIDDVDCPRCGAELDTRAGTELAKGLDICRECAEEMWPPQDTDEWTHMGADE